MSARLASLSGFGSWYNVERGTFNSSHCLTIESCGFDSQLADLLVELRYLRFVSCGRLRCFAFAAAKKFAGSI
jgi:hypothetical protein